MTEDILKKKAFPISKHSGRRTSSSSWVKKIDWLVFFLHSYLKIDFFFTILFVPIKTIQYV